MTKIQLQTHTNCQKKKNLKWFQKEKTSKGKHKTEQKLGKQERVDSRVPEGAGPCGVSF